jgi:hypothetical protein
LSKNRYTVEKVYGRNHDLVNRYGISVSQMTMDMYQLSKALAGNFLIHDFMAIILSDLLLLTDFDCPFGIFRLF